MEIVIQRLISCSARIRQQVYASGGDLRCWRWERLPQETWEQLPPTAWDILNERLAIGTSTSELVYFHFGHVLSQPSWVCLSPFILQRLGQRKREV